LSDAKKTFLYDQHVALGGRVVDFHGWLLPLQYDGILAEHGYCRTQVALFDTSHMGQFILEGSDVAAGVSRLLTHDVTRLPVGRCRYTHLLNERGGIIDDAVVMRLGEREFLFAANAAPAPMDLYWIRHHLAGDAVVTNQSEGWGKVDVQGPLAYDVLAPLVDGDLASLRYFRAARMTCMGVPAIVSRTGYTGELGYEVHYPGDALPALWSRLVEDERVHPAGLGARDLLRLEMCFPLYGKDIADDSNPLEADLELFVSTVHDYIGAQALRKWAAEGVRRKLVPFRSETRRSAREGNPILADDRPVGVVTSGAFSPSLGVSIGMGYVEAPFADVGRRLTVETARAKLPVVVSEKPLYRKGTRRMKPSELRARTAGKS